MTFEMIKVYERLLQSEGWQVLISMQDIMCSTNCTFQCQFEGNVNKGYDYAKIYQIYVHMENNGNVIVEVK